MVAQPIYVCELFIISPLSLRGFTNFSLQSSALASELKYKMPGYLIRFLQNVIIDAILVNLKTDTGNFFQSAVMGARNFLERSEGEKLNYTVIPLNIQSPSLYLLQKYSTLLPSHTISCQHQGLYK